jgi:hypothetical protein
MPPPLWLVLFPLTVPRNRGGAVSRFRPRSIVLRGQVDEFIEFRDCPWLAGTRANPGGAFRLRLRQVVQGPTFLRVALVGISSGFVLISLDASSASLSLSFLRDLPLDGRPEDRSGCGERQCLESAENVGATGVREFRRPDG